MYMASLGVMIRMNENGGIDDADFQKYLFGSIIVLYPNARSVKGKWAIIKVVSGLGSLNKTLLAQLRNLGSILYPGGPNMTAMIQQTERNYEPFKTQLRNNLDLVLTQRLAKQVSLSVQPWLYGIIMFLVSDPETGYFVKTSVFEFVLSRAHCKNALANIGAAPLTMACLTYTKVRQHISDTNNHTNDLMHELQDSNDLAVFQLH